MKRAAIYCRVSSSEQANKDTSIPTQRKMLQKYVKEHDMTIVKEYIDAGFSAYKDIESRKNFLEMIADAKEKPKPFDAILYCYNNRVFRNMENAVYYRAILRRKCNIELICITQPIDVSTPTGQLVERFMDAISEWDSATKGEVIKAVMTNQSEKGIVLGEPPYGYAIDENTGKYTVYEPEAKIVRYIFDEYINGGSLRSIGKDLRTNGINIFGKAALVKVSKAVNNKNKHKDRNLTWGAKTVRKIIKNKVYLGEYKWNGKIIKNNHKPIISKETYKLANIILYNNSITKKDSPDYLLKDLIKCYECGGSLSQRNRVRVTKAGEKRNYRKLRCSNHAMYSNCYTNYNDMKEIEEQLINELNKIIEGRIKYEDLNIIHESNNHEKKIIQLQNKLEGFDEQFDRQMEAYQAGIIDLSQLKKYKDKLLEEKLFIEDEINKLKDMQEDNELNQKLLFDKVNNTLSTLLDEKIDLQKKKNALKLLIESIHISKEKDLMIVTFRL